MISYEDLCLALDRYNQKRQNADEMATLDGASEQEMADAPVDGAAQAASAAAVIDGAFDDGAIDDGAIDDGAIDSSAIDSSAIGDAGADDNSAIGDAGADDEVALDSTSTDQDALGEVAVEQQSDGVDGVLADSNLLSDDVGGDGDPTQISAFEGEPEEEDHVALTDDSATVIQHELPAEYVAGNEEQPAADAKLADAEAVAVTDDDRAEK